LRNLFSQIILSYAVDFFIVSYGHTETIIKEDESLIDGYICSSCENENFYSANKYQNNYFWYASIQTLFEEKYLLSIKPTINYEDKNKVLKANKIVQSKYK
jgi:hypothetical protein